MKQMCDAVKCGGGYHSLGSLRVKLDASAAKCSSSAEHYCARRTCSRSLHSNCLGRGSSPLQAERSNQSATVPRKEQGRVPTSGNSLSETNLHL